jgi:Protein of unknown function (DUF3606)
MTTEVGSIAMPFISLASPQENPNPATSASAPHCNSTGAPGQSGKSTCTFPRSPEPTLLARVSADTTNWRREMADDRTKRGPADRQRISLSEDYEVTYWTQKWSVSREQLAEAVRRVGPMSAAVAKELKKEL